MSPVWVWELQVTRSVLCVAPICIAFVEVEATNATITDDKPLCSLSCYLFTLIDGLKPDTVTTERVALTKKDKEQLKKEARDCQVKVNCKVNGVSRDALKQVIIASLLKKIFSCILHWQLYGVWKR
jgi:hypothetical protein